MTVYVWCAVLLVGCSDRGAEKTIEGSSVITFDGTTVPTVLLGGTLPEDNSAILPPVAPEAGVVVAEFLAGPGVPLVLLRGVAERFVGVESPVAADCVEALDSLADGPPPDQLGGIAGDVPDVVLSGAFLDLIVATDDYLSRCAQGEDLAQAVATLGEASSLVAERLGAL